jgi:outer membrane protein OmpA-like peptidoglycan-associated protein/Sec-independent protein translocase protein TatA
MRTPRLFVRTAVALLVLSLASAPVGAAQLGGLGRIGDAARRAKEELEARTRKEEEAKKAEEAKAKAEADAAAKKEAEAKQAPPAPAAAPAATAGAAPGTTPAAQPAADAPPSFQAFSKFDFVPGEKVMALDDFTQDAVGDFPAKWNTNASGEIVTIAGRPGRWLKLAGTGYFVPEFISALPDDFTLEFDVLTPPTFEGYPLNAVLTDLAPGAAANFNTPTNGFALRLLPGSGGAGTSETQVRQDSASAAQTSKPAAQFTKGGNPVHVSMWRQRQRIRVYLNEEKAWDLPRAFLATAKLSMLVFGARIDDAKGEYYLGNLRLAVGAPDTRNKIITEGKWVSHGILFDVNSDRIKGESYGSLKEIANVLTEAADVRVVIVGHTDSDGDTAANLDLSRRRAAAVKTALATEFKIDAGRMDTDGKGEGEPVDKNDTPAGKANNRRVEFIRK